MIERFVPDVFSQSIYRIDYKALKDRGIELLIFDLDNTIAPITESEPSKEAINLMFELKDMGFRCILMTNSGKKRTEIFRNKLEIDTCAKARKPFKKKYKKILRLYNKEPEKVAAIGDQLLTDILGANNLGIVSILVHPICKKDYFFTSFFNRKVEKKLFDKMEKKGVFKRGKYYE